MLNFIATDLQLYMIFKITRIWFFGTQCTFHGTRQWALNYKINTEFTFSKTTENFYDLHYYVMVF